MVKKNKEEKPKTSRKTTKKDKIKKLKIDKEIKSLSQDREELIEIREKRYTIQISVLIFLAIIVLVLLCNKTFFKEGYKNDKVQIDLPVFMFYTSDKDNVITLKTLRKSEYVRNYFEDYLEKLDYYVCNNEIYYYDSYSKTVIKDIKVTKNLVVKTVKIEYSNKTIEEICVSPENTTN